MHLEGLSLISRLAIKALKNKIIAGATLNIFETESQVPDEPCNLTNVVLIPHIGTSTVETRIKKEVI